MDAVYRIQNEDGVGPYVISGLVDFETEIELRDLLSHHNGQESGENGYHPIPTCDPDIERPAEKHEICGFKDIDQLEAWFSPNELMELKALGFRIVRMGGKITANGMYQVLFIPEKDLKDLTN
jgi:hypothetical protein